MGLILNSTWNHHEPTLPASSKRSDRRTQLFPLGRLLTCARQVVRRLARLHLLRRHRRRIALLRHLLAQSPTTGNFRSHRLEPARFVGRRRIDHDRLGDGLRHIGHLRRRGAMFCAAEPDDTTLDTRCAKVSVRP